MADNGKQLIDVIIGGRVFKLSASENPDYIKNVATYIDKKLRELNVSAASNIMNDDNFAIILALNIADELFKEKEKDGDEVDLSEPTPEQARQIAELKNQLASRTNDYDLLLNQFQAKSSEVSGLKDTVYAHEDTIEKIKAKAQAYKNESEERRKTIENKSQYITDLSKKINDKNQELNTLSKKLAEKNNALNELNKKSAEKNIKLNNVNKERDELALKLKSTTNSLKAAEKELAENIKMHEDELMTVAANNDKTVSTLNAKHKAEVDLLEDKIKTLEHENTVLSEDSTALKKEYEKFQSHLENATDGQLKAAFAKTKAENIELRRTVEELKNTLSAKKSGD